MLNNFKVKTKIMFLSSVLLIFCIIMGVAGYYFNSLSSQRVKDMYNNSLMSVESLNDLRAQARTNEANLLFVIEYSNNPTNQKTFIDDIATRANNADKDIEQYKSIGSLDKYEQDQLNIINTNLSKFREVRQKAIELSQQGKREDAFNLVTQNIELQDAYQKAMLDLSVYHVKEAGVADQQNDSNDAASKRIFISLFGISSLLGIILTFLISSSISKPLIYITKYLKNVANGDFSQPISEEYMISKDELGDIAKATNQMQLSVKDIIQAVISESNSVNEAVNHSYTNIAILSDNLEEASATVEELSAGMEQTAASTQEINATTAEIGTAIETIAEKAQDGAMSANEISKKANELKDNAISSQANAHSIRLDIDKAMKEAIEKSKEVERINQLANAILDISSQTNLLALNAAIEAARAGEAGKGFSVVADEIRKLAESSKTTVNEIQNTIKIVFEAVNSLAENSKRTLEYIDTHAVDGYGKLVRTGEDYNKDSVFIEELVTDLSATSEELLASVKNVADAMDEISRANNEGAAGTSEIAEKITNITIKANEVKFESELIQQSADKLKVIVSQFTI